LIATITLFRLLDTSNFRDTRKQLVKANVKCSLYFGARS